MPDDISIYDDPEYRRLEDLIWELVNNGSEVDLDSLVPPNRPDFLVPLERVIRRARLRWTPCDDDQALPSCLGRYRLESVLGRGKFGQVWRGYDPELNRSVAIKLPLSDRTASRLPREAFLKEAQKMAHLDDHRSIVTVYDVGQDGPYDFIVSKLIDGGSLADRITEGRLALQEAVKIVADVADALHHAHRSGIFHRDIKPRNILLDKGGKAYVTDFGLAVTEDELLEEHGAVSGTLAYMSPEQANGNSLSINASTDIYSLGVVLYELLTGRLPFQGRDFASLRQWFISGELQPPRTIDERIPLDLEGICLKAMSKQPADRFSNADDMANALRNQLSRRTVPPKDKWFSGRGEELATLRARLRDDRAGVICGVHGLGGIGKTELAFAYAHDFADVYPGGRFLVPCERKNSLRDAALCLGDLFREGISDEKRKTPDGYFAAIADCLRERLDRLGHVLLVLDNVTDPAVVSATQTDALTVLGPKLHLLATTRLRPPSGKHWLALGELSEADALDLLEKHRPFADEAEREAGRRLVRRLGRFALAVELVAAWLREHPGGSYARLLDGLGLNDLEDLAADQEVERRRHNHERRLSAVLGLVWEGLQPAERRTLEYAAILPADCVALPWLRILVTRDFPELARPGRLDRWVELWRRLLRLALFRYAEGEGTVPRLVRVHRLVQAWVRNLAAGDLAARQEAVDGVVLSRNAELDKTAHWEATRWEVEPFDALANLWADSNHPQAVWLLNQVGLYRFHLAEWTRVEPLMRRALDITEASSGPDHPDVAACLDNLASLLLSTNRLAEAEPLIRRALAITEARCGPDHPGVAACLNNLAQLLQATNRLAEAEPLMWRVLAIQEASYGPDHPSVATALNNLAWLLQATDRSAEAEPPMRRALAIHEASYGPDHPEVADRLNALAVLLITANRLAEAEPLIWRGLAIYKASYGPEHPKVATALNNLARLFQATNRLAEAEPVMRRVLIIDEATYGPEHPNVATDVNNLARLLQATNRLAESEPLMQRVLAIDEAIKGPDHADVASDLDNLAQVLQATDRLAEAEPLMRRAVEILIRLTDANGQLHPGLPAVRERYAALLTKMGRSKQGALAEVDVLAERYGVNFDG